MKIEMLCWKTIQAWQLTRVHAGRFRKWHVVDSMGTDSRIFCMFNVLRFHPSLTTSVSPLTNRSPIADLSKLWYIWWKASGDVHPLQICSLQCNLKHFFPRVADLIPDSNWWTLRSVYKPAGHCPGNKLFSEEVDRRDFFSIISVSASEYAKSTSSSKLASREIRDVGKRR